MMGDERDKAGTKRDEPGTTEDRIGDEAVSLWGWALAAYARPGVAAACLALQDGQGQNVPLLLWAAWCAETGRRFDDEAAEEARDLARAWEGTAVSPLRALRRRLKIRHPDLEPARLEAVRAQVKAAELLAERALLDGLEATGSAPTAPWPTAEALVRAAKAWNRVVPRPLLNALAGHLSA